MVSVKILYIKNKLTHSSKFVKKNNNYYWHTIMDYSCTIQISFSSLSFTLYMYIAAEHALQFLALFVLPHLILDVRCSPDSNKIVYFTQV